jgi:RNA polymerase primary sigma factor
MKNNINYYNELSTYCNTLKSNKGLSREKERELALRIQEGDEKALNELVEANLKYVVTLAKQFAWTGLPIYDLISEGNLGLIRAARKFDPDRGNKFITCAKPWIKQSIDYYIKSQNIDKEFTNVEDYVFEQEPDENLINDDFESEVETSINRIDAINQLLDSLNKRERRVLQLYFGLNGNQEKTLDEIGQDMGLTQERVRQIKEESIEKLQFKVMSNNSFAEYKELY